MVKKILNDVRNFLKLRLRRPWVKYGKNVHIQWSVRIWSPNKILEIGDNVGIGAHSTIHTDVRIGSHVLIAAHTALIARDAHSLSVVGTTMFDSQRGDKYSIIIEDDVWIGFGAIILSGVRIGRGSVIAAGSIVTKDVPPYSIVASPPSRIIRKRFSEEEIQEHERILRSKIE